MKKLLRNILLQIIYGSKKDSASYIHYLRKRGVSIGENCVFYDPITTTVDVQNPHLLTLGDNVRITKGVTILTHDYSWAVISGVYGECLGSIGKVKIGNNVFIGIDVIITKNVEIGDNVIIGAGSVVTKNCLSNSVYAGNPARRIMSLDEFYEKKKSLYLKDLKSIMHEIQMLPKEKQEGALREFSVLFKDIDHPDVIKLMKDTGYYEVCRKYYTQHPKAYKDMDELINNLKD